MLGVFFLERVHDALEEDLNDGVAGLGEHAGELVEGDGLGFRSRCPAPEDSHDREAVLLLHLGEEFDFAAKVIGAMLEEHPFQRGLGADLGRVVAGLDRLELDFAAEEGVGEEGDVFVADLVGKPTATIGCIFPGERGLAQGGGVFAAVGGLAGPDGVPYLVVSLFLI